MTLTVGSLFSGIGGLDLGLERAGMTVRWQSEIDPYASRVLVKHWPTVPNLGDITTIDWSGVEPVDLICGGYPCQPFSLAGARGGDTDRRHLWPYFADALRNLRPRYALLENVPGHLSLGFGRVLGDLAELGFDADWDCIPAAAVGAPHLRYRVFVVAHAQRDELRQQPVAIFGGSRPTIVGDDGAQQYVADAACRREQDQQHGSDAVGQSLRSIVVGTGDRTAQWCSASRDRDSRGRASILAGDVAAADRPRFSYLQGSATVTELAGSRAVDGAGWWDVEPDVGRVADGVPSRVDRLRCLGNAVVPQVAELIGRRIVAAHLERSAA